RAFIVGENQVAEFPTADGLIQDMSGELKRVASDIAKANKDLNLNADVSYKYLIEPLPKFKGIFEAYKLQRDEAISERDEADATFTAAIASREDTIKTLTKDLAEQRSLVAEAQQEVEDAKSSHLTVVERLKQEFEEKEEEWTEKELGTNRQLQRKDSEIGTLGILVKKLQARDRQLLTLEDAKPDGKLVHVSNQLGKGWVNIGRRNHLKTGLIFRVYRPIKGGKKMYKGRIEVRQVDEQQAEVRIIEEVDPERNPVTSGDLITSPFYDQKEEPIFVFAGTKLTSQEMTEDFLRAKLKGYGVSVKGSVDINTSYLVALQDYEKTTEFKVAERLGVPVLREKELMEFIGY
ncbi:MAG: BRCT domain-containing protein, partial [Planctomycetota bacterium]|nr:BRCT domain-containing protein [Planctomycetota bacterium]